MTDTPGQLDYAPRPHALRGARARRVAIVIGSLLLLASILWVAPRAYRRWQVTQWQRQCLRYVAPPDRVVHETDPAEIPRLVAPPLNYRGSLATGQAFYIPPAYSNLVVSQSVGTAFLHERVSRGGERRLVAVDLFGGTMQPNRTMSLNAVMLPIGRGGRDWSLATMTTGDGTNISLQSGDKLRVFAGQVDPDDRSHFTIDYVLNGTRRTLDGWLVDGGTVKIETRD
jgi:hypothetical protein